MNEVAYLLVRKAVARGRPCSVGPEGGIDLRVRASANTIRFDLSRAPSLAMIPAWRPSLLSDRIFDQGGSLCYSMNSHADCQNDFV